MLSLSLLILSAHADGVVNENAFLRHYLVGRSQRTELLPEEKALLKRVREHSDGAKMYNSLVPYQKARLVVVCHAALGVEQEKGSVPSWVTDTEFRIKESRKLAKKHAAALLRLLEDRELSTPARAEAVHFCYLGFRYFPRDEQVKFLATLKALTSPRQPALIRYDSAMHLLSLYSGGSVTADADFLRSLLDDDHNISFAAAERLMKDGSKEGLRRLIQLLPSYLQFLLCEETKRFLGRDCRDCVTFVEEELASRITEHVGLYPKAWAQWVTENYESIRWDEQRERYEVEKEKER